MIPSTTSYKYVGIDMVCWLLSGRPPLLAQGSENARGPLLLAPLSAGGWFSGAGVVARRAEHLRVRPFAQGARGRRLRRTGLGGSAGSGMRVRFAVFFVRLSSRLWLLCFGFVFRKCLKAINIEFNVNTHSKVCLNRSMRS